MKFVALISGGKDSCFNIMHCLKEGHELVALANLHPTDKSQQELDSFMFQTVGHDIIPSYAKCTGLPLFRKEILPFRSKNVELNYTPTINDEVEELYELLATVTKEIPDIGAVSVGAILSSYQRTRVEDVCARLGLVPLSYLWQRSQLELMQEMCYMSELDFPGKFEARLIKVAAVGLNQSALGKTLSQIYPDLVKLHKMYDVHICGEGGEFETMVLDAPFFSKGYLKLLDKQDSSSNENDGVHSTRLIVEFVKRELSNDDIQRHIDALPQPRLLNEQWQELCDHVEDISLSEPCSALGNHEIMIPYNISVDVIGNILSISNIFSKKTATLEEQMQDIFEQLDNILNNHQVEISQVLHCSLILSDMSLFPLVNRIYADYFDVLKNGPLPPARVCISSPLPNRQLVQLSLVSQISSDCKKSKNGLHVQGYSYWAPCNIGPYSQEIWLSDDPNKVAFISGQIALEPATMNLAKKDIKLHAALSLKHFDTLRNAINTGNLLSLTCFVNNHSVVPAIHNAWSLYCTDMSYKSDLWAHKSDDPLESLIIVEVKHLPKQSLCEWTGITCQELFVQGEDDEQEYSRMCRKLSLGDSKQIIVENPWYQRQFITGFADNLNQFLEILGVLPRSFKLTLYCNPTHVTRDLGSFSFEYFPVYEVYDHKGRCRRYGYQAFVWSQ